MTRKFWLKLGKAPQLSVKRILDNRIVFCANCDANRTLSVSSSGTLACSSCGSGNWMYLSAPIIANFKQYNENKVQERIAVEKYIDKLEREVFFTANSVLV
jgi:ribosomal protein L33